VQTGVAATVRRLMPYLWLRVLAVVRALRGKPCMQRVNEPRIIGCVANLCAVWQRYVVHVDLRRPCFSCGRAWHVAAMDRRRIGEMPPATPGGFVREMRLNQRDLRGVGRIVGRDRLEACPDSTCPIRQ
jgi:hypothetical protein